MICISKLTGFSRKTALAVVIAACTGLMAHAQNDNAAIQLRTNGLYDLAACPNIGVEFQAENGISWQADYIGAFIRNDARNRCYQNWAVQTELRYYLKHDIPPFPFVGHHVGVYTLFGAYDFEFGGTGYQSKTLHTYSVGLSYGYVKRLNKRFSVDFTVGLGYFSTRYDKYRPKEDNTGYMRLDRRRFSFVGPTKLEVSLVLNLNYKNKFWY